MLELRELDISNSMLTRLPAEIGLMQVCRPVVDMQTSCCDVVVVKGGMVCMLQCIEPCIQMNG